MVRGYSLPDTIRQLDNQLQKNPGTQSCFECAEKTSHIPVSSARSSTRGTRRLPFAAWSAKVSPDICGERIPKVLCEQPFIQTIKARWGSGTNDYPILVSSLNTMNDLNKNHWQTNVFLYGLILKENHSFSWTNRRLRWRRKGVP